MSFYFYLFFTIIFTAIASLKTSVCNAEEIANNRPPLILPKDGYIRYKSNLAKYSNPNTSAGNNFNNSPNSPNGQNYNQQFQKKSYDEPSNQKLPYQSQNQQFSQQGFQKQQIPAAIMPQRNARQFQTSPEDERNELLKRRQAFANSMKNGFELSVYTNVAGGSGKYDFRLPAGWNVSRVSPEITGDNDASFSISTSDSTNQIYQNIRDNEVFNSKLLFANIGLHVRLKLPSFFSNDLQILRPFVYFSSDYSTIQPIEIEATKEVGSTNSSFQNVKAKYTYEGLKYSNIIGAGGYLVKGLYASYGQDIYNKKKRMEFGYDFDGIIVYFANEKLKYQTPIDSSRSANSQLTPYIENNSYIAGLKFKVL